MKCAWMVSVFAIAFACFSTCQAASFDCAKASTKAETMICGSQVLNDLDKELGLLYGRVISTETSQQARDQYKTMQRKWLKEERDVCGDVKCMALTIWQQCEIYRTTLEKSSIRTSDITETGASFQIIEKLLRGSPSDLPKTKEQSKPLAAPAAASPPPAESGGSVRAGANESNGTAGVSIGDAFLMLSEPNRKAGCAIFSAGATDVVGNKIQGQSTQAVRSALNRQLSVYPLATIKYVNFMLDSVETNYQKLTTLYNKNGRDVFLAFVLGQCFKDNGVMK